jgi:hypothetical protein
MDPNQIPAFEPPDGVESNFINPETQQTTLIVASVITLFLVVGGISARTYTKAAIMKQFDITDCMSLSKTAFSRDRQANVL